MASRAKKSQDTVGQTTNFLATERKGREIMALQLRRIVTGHDANGKAIVASDEQMTGAASPSRPDVSHCRLGSPDKRRADISEGAAAGAQRKGSVVRHNYVGSGQG